jgi:hypothetical protein
MMFWNSGYVFLLLIIEQKPGELGRQSQKQRQQSLRAKLLKDVLVKRRERPAQTVKT